MRAIQFHRYGGPEVLELHDDLPEPVPGPGEALIEVAVAGVTLPVVRLSRDGNVPLPHSPGGEVCGRIADSGERVTGLAFQGAYAELAAVPRAMLTGVPDEVPDADAVALIRSGHVALGALSAARVEPGDRVLITAAASSVGHLAVQLARVLGAARVVAACGDRAKGDFLPGLGADEVRTYSDLAEGQFDVVLDLVGGDVQASALPLLAPLGRFVACNAVGGPLDANDLRMHSRTVIGFAMAHLARLAPQVYAEHEQRLWRLHSTGELRPAIHATLPLAEAAQAHRIIEARANRGKVMLAPTWR
jgi:NADPH2:quinone reductase